MNKFREGDVIKCFRGLYWHFGVYVGNDTVIHFSTLDSGDFDFKNADIIKTSLDQFSQGCYTSVDNSVRAGFPKDEIARRAISKLGTQKGTYNLVTNNCEHFANWCKSGRVVSNQVEFVARQQPWVHLAYEVVRQKTENCYDQSRRNESPFKKIGDVLGGRFGRLLT